MLEVLRQTDRYGGDGRATVIGADRTAAIARQLPDAERPWPLGATVEVVPAPNIVSGNITGKPRLCFFST
jgi:hypothetical protein